MPRAKAFMCGPRASKRAKVAAVKAGIRKCIGKSGKWNGFLLREEIFGGEAGIMNHFH